jgi:tetratricopeptide (TPR) repeat protein
MHLRRLVSLDHKTGPGFALLGLCEYETKEYRRALDHINEARRLGLGEDPQVRRVVLYHAVLLLTRFQQYESAQQLLGKVLKTGEAGPAVIEAAGLAGLRRPILPQNLPPGDKDLVDLAGRAVCATAGEPAGGGTKILSPNCWPNIRTRPASTISTDRSCWPAMRTRVCAKFKKKWSCSPKMRRLWPPLPWSMSSAVTRKKAIPYAQRAVAADPQFFAAHGVLGRLLANAGEVEKGIKELEIARQQAPDSPQVHFSLAAAYAMAGKKEDAARERAEFVRLKQLADEMGK